jgi:hypothetical protein
MEACDGDEVKVRLIQRLADKFGFANLGWLADQLDWLQTAGDALPSDAIADELYRRMPADVRDRLSTYYTAHPEDRP